MIIDFHTHVFPEKLAARAVENMGRQVHLTPCTDGTIACTEKLMKEQGVDQFVALNIAVSPRTQAHVNEFAVETAGTHPAFGSVHPDSPDALAALDALAAAGIKGVKFHNEYQNFFVDDEKAFPLYEKIEKLHLAAVFHGGYDPGFPPPVKASPERCARVAATFPKAKFIFAHLGGLAMPDDAVKYLKNTAALIDTAYMAGAYTPADAERVIKEFGADRVLFGSDCPWDTPANTLAFLKKLHLSEEETEKILFKNALKILA